MGMCIPWVSISSGLGSTVTDATGSAPVNVKVKVKGGSSSIYRKRAGLTYDQVFPKNSHTLFDEYENENEGALAGEKKNSWRRYKLRAVTYGRTEMGGERKRKSREKKIIIYQRGGFM